MSGADDFAERNNPLLAFVWPDGSVHPIMPGKRPDYGQSRWESRGQARWNLQAGTTTFLWRWQSPILDLRPEYADTDNIASGIATVPINRTAVFGAGTYLRLLVWTHAAVDIAEVGGLSVSYREMVNDQPPQHMTNQAVAGITEAPLFCVSQATDVTDFILEAGRTANIGGLAYRGAALLYFSPPAEGIRFWQVFLDFTIDKQNAAFNPNTLAMNWQGSAY